MATEPAQTTTETDDAIQAAIAEAESLSSDSNDADTQVVPVPVSDDRGFTRRSPADNTDIGALVVAVSDVDDAVAADEAQPQQTQRSLGRLLYSVADSALWALNYPFSRLRPATRQLIGIAAIVTIVTSLLAHMLIPIMFPPRDAITILQDRAESVRDAVEATSD